MNNKGQVTIFIIIAIVIIAGIAVFIAYRQGAFEGRLSASMQPIEETFKSCLEDYSLIGVNVLMSQGGYIYLPDFESGSTYMPFSSQLEFMGSAIPYWYYVSGNNIQKEQVPSKSEMENQLEQFIEEKARNCVFDKYYEQGFEILMDEPNANADISGSSIKVGLDMGMEIRKGEDVGKVKKHSVEINSKLGSLYASAKEVYDKEQNDLFLEEYGIDILRLYAPVDGVEITCSPKIWIAEDIFDELQQAVEANTLALKTKGDKEDYFVVDAGVSDDVRFINSPDWPYTIEVSDDDGVLIANPIGNQAGLGILGFCYVPYHFVYDLKYPVLVQVSDDDEIFQFPMAVIIQSNNPREPLETNAVELELPELCKYKNAWINVDVHNTNMVSVDADVSFECLGTKCNLGKAEDGSLSAAIPQCMNGFIVAQAEGYQQERYQYDKIDSGSVNIILKKIHELNVDLKLDGKTYSGNAIITFNSESGSRTIAYPEQKSVELGEGEYDISVFVYKQGNLKFESFIKEQCVEVPRSGVLGIVGLTQKKCFDIEIPEQIITDVLAGGGNQKDYFVDSQLENSNTIEIKAESIDVPETIEELQNSYIIFESKGLEVSFR